MKTVVRASRIQRHRAFWTTLFLGAIWVVSILDGDITAAFLVTVLLAPGIWDPRAWL